MDYDILSQISMSKKNCKIKVRVVRSWDSIIPPFQNLISTDFLLLDEQETSIQAFARKQEASDFKDSLKEGNVYYLANFNILPNKKSYRAANGKYIIQLTRSTTVTETKDHIDAMPLHKFTFTDFLDISDENENNVNLIEVIGQIISVGSVTHVYAGLKLTSKRNVEIQNLSYKLKTVVEDDTTTANFIIFRKLAQDLLHIPASQFAATTNGDRYTLPPLINNILGSTYIFQVTLSTSTFNTERTFTVIKILSPPEIETVITCEQFASHPLLQYLHITILNNQKEREKIN